MHKTRRLNRILARDGRALIVAMDHGAIQGPKGLERPGEVIRQIADGGADAVLTTYGMVRTFGKELAPLGVIMRTDGGASTIGPDISESAPRRSPWSANAPAATMRPSAISDGSGDAALSSFQSGAYLSWDIKGSVKIRVTNKNPGANAVVSGIFLDAAN